MSMADIESGTGMPSSGASKQPPLFSQTNVRKPEYWQFAKLIAPAPQLPEGKKMWTTDDAVGIWCLKCAKALPYLKGSSQSIRYHMETKHYGSLASYRSAKEVTEKANNKASKRKASFMTPTFTDIESDPFSREERQVSSSSSSRRDSPHTAPHSSNTTTSGNHHGAGAEAISWRKNVERRSGFWGNAYWYDHNLLRRMPLAKPMLEELIAALPPCDGKQVLDLCAGSGRATCALLDAYPTAHVTLYDSSEERLHIAQSRLLATGKTEDQTCYVTESFGSSLPLTNSPYDVIIGSLALHVLVEKPRHYSTTPGTIEEATNESSSAVESYERIFRILFDSLAPGGHLIFGDHVGKCSLFQQLLLMQRVGFVDVDCSWRQDEYFVAGGCKPLSLSSPADTTDSDAVGI